MNIVAFVPIKLESERLPNKNILQLGKHRLCYYIFDTLKKAGIDEIYVFCSNDLIKEYIPSFVKYKKRDIKLDNSLTKGLDIYKNFYELVNKDVDAYVLAHTTSPFLKPISLVKGIKSLQDGFDSALSVQKIKTFSWYNNKPLNYKLDDIPRTQDIEPIYIETSGFYIFKKEVIENGRRVGNNPAFIEVDELEAIDIDTKKDFEFAKKLIGII